MTQRLLRPLVLCGLIFPAESLGDNKRKPATQQPGKKSQAPPAMLPAQLLTEADALMDGVSDTLEHFYRSQVRASLAEVSPS